MEIQLLKTNNPPNKINKSFTTIKSVSGNLIEPYTVTDVQVEFEYNSDIGGFNEIYIPSLARYYFINNISITGNLFTIVGSVDVLCTYKTLAIAYIRSYTGIATNIEFESIFDTLPHYIIVTNEIRG